MEKKSIVKEANYKKSFTGKYGETFIHEITFENGDKGEYLSKQFNQDKFILGKETEYNIETRQNGNYTNTTIKPVDNKGGSGGGRKFTPDLAKTPCMVLAYAKDLAIADKIKFEQILPCADKMLEWVKKHEQQQTA